jgi:hypothetical protein
MLGSQWALNDGCGVMDRINRIFQDEQDEFFSITSLYPVNPGKSCSSCPIR